MLGLSRVESHIRPLRRMVTGRADVYRVQSSSLRTGVKEIVTRFAHHALHSLPIIYAAPRSAAQPRTSCSAVLTPFIPSR